MHIGTVSGWPNTFAALLVSYEADWLSPRSYGSCYLTIPSLSSEGGSDYADKMAEVASPAAPPLLVTAATYASVVLKLQGIDESTVSPDATSGGATRHCGSFQLVQSQIGYERHYHGLRSPDEYFATKLRGYEVTVPQGGSDCGGVVVLAEPGADDKRSVFIFVLGAVFTLGLTRILEAIREPPRPPGLP